MRRNTMVPSTKLWNDQSLVIVGLGSLGQRVLQISRQEFERLRIPSSRLSSLSLAQAGTRSEAEQVLQLQPFDLGEYIARPENESLRQHLPADFEAADHPWNDHSDALLGFLSFHRYDEELLTPKFRLQLEKARKSNPQGRLRCIFVLGMECGFSAGLLLPLLYRLAADFERHRAVVDVFMATSARLQNPPEHPASRQSLAFAKVLEQAFGGEEAWTYPGRSGLREDRKFEQLPHIHPYVFSAGAGQKPYSENVIASVLSNCILTLVSTPLGVHLEGEQARAHEELFERTWEGSNSGKHPTNLLTYNVAGVKLDVFPSLLHLRRVRRLLEQIAKPVSPSRSRELGERVESTLRAAHLDQEGIVQQLQIGSRPMTYVELKQADLPPDELHPYIVSRLSQDIDALLSLGDNDKQEWPVEDFLQETRFKLDEVAWKPLQHGEISFPEAIQTYRNLQRELENLSRQTLETARWARRELGASPNRRRLDQLLARLEADTIQENGPPLTVAEQFGATATVAIPMQVRKILQVAQEVRQHALAIGSAQIVSDVCLSLAEHCEVNRQQLQDKLLVLNNAASLTVRDEEHLQRVSRSAFTYQKNRFESLIGDLLVRVEEQLPQVDLGEIVKNTGGDLASFVEHEDQVLERLLDLTRVDETRLVSVADTVFAAAGSLRDAVQEAVSQLQSTVPLDRAMLRRLPTRRQRYLICSRAFMQQHLEDLQLDAEWIEAATPFNVLVSEHEEGFPFAAMPELRQKTDTSESDAVFPGWSSKIGKRRLDD